MKWIGSWRTRWEGKYTSGQARCEAGAACSQTASSKQQRPCSDLQLEDQMGGQVHNNGQLSQPHMKLRGINGVEHAVNMQNVAQ
jgi:hypothetical protein